MIEQSPAVEQTYVQAGPDEPAILARFGVDATALLEAAAGDLRAVGRIEALEFTAGDVLEVRNVVLAVPAE